MVIGTEVTLRKFRWDDLQASVEIINAVYRSTGNDYNYTEEELKHEMIEPGFDAERDAFVMTTGEGRVVAFGDVTVPDEGGRVFGRGYVHPDFRRQGLGTRLLRASDAHVLEMSKDLPQDPPIYEHRFEIANEPFQALMKAEGYTITRKFYRMIIDDLPESAPALPDGITLRPFDVERDARAVYEASTEAFRDNWGGEAPQTFEMWSYDSLEKSDFDPALWMIAYDGDEIAGMALCRYFTDVSPDMGYVNTLAVRRPWRRRGLGGTLLRQAFVMFREKGYKRVGLGVDSSNQTNAVALYENAGMRINQRREVYQKVLRGDASKVPM